MNTPNTLAISLRRLLTLAMLAALWTPIASAQDEGPPADPPEATTPSQAEPKKQPRVGEEVVIEYKNGRSLTGLFVVQDEHLLTIKISGVNVDIPQAEIDTVVPLGTPMERYRQMRPAIPDDDAQRLITLARWLQTYKLYREGLTEVELAIESDPTNMEAWRLKRELEGQVAILDAKEKGARPDDSIERERRRESETNREDLREKIQAASSFDLLNEKQIGLIKVYELNLNDPPPIRIAHSTIERFMLQYVDHPLVPSTREGRKAFLRKSPEEVLDIMFRARARDFYSEVEVIGDPQAIRIFRDRVQAGWLVNNCATSRCHGGPDVGELWLANKRPRSDAATYTNLLILERTTLPDGTPLIDYERPANSALLQLGLPPDDSSRAHPEVIGWRPAFRNRDARAFGYAVDWINAMYRPRPDYSIEYTPPALRSEPTEEVEEKFEPVER